jgi:hypothetical protein
MEKPFPERRRNLDNLVYTGPERRRTSYVAAGSLEPGMHVDEKGIIANTFSNADGSYRVVFESGEIIEHLDRDDGLDVLNEQPANDA